ncbi:hypothetical protein ANCDUO_18731 [Ancylostoma duodenale]|uniref:Tetraspanin family protein n=1 Tax=Ancylostoma duodenale TaxID=51022 RepID=A0A0C2G2A2_9BILA|nr:hypothetical protein ANCDUO_18731 [Ancylostoma duodenale]
MQFSGQQVFAWIILLLGTGILVSSFTSDFWSTHTRFNQHAFEVVIAGLLISSITMACAVVVTGPFCCQKCRVSTTFIVLLTGVCVGTACFVYWQANLEGQTFTLQHTPIHDLFSYEYVS